MAGKLPVFCASRLFYGIDKLSKNFLIDCVMDKVLVELPEGASDEEVAVKLQPLFDTIARYRGDRPINLMKEVEKFDRYNEKYRERLNEQKSAAGHE